MLRSSFIEPIAGRVASSPDGEPCIPARKAVKAFQKAATGTAFDANSIKLTA
jgi:hypothetical protein